MTSIDNKDKLLEGFFTVCEAVSRTMGAQGGLAIMENEMFGNPLVTKDGISAAKRIFFKDREKNMGANLAKQIAAKTLVTAGDSTTTSLVLAQALVKATLTRRHLFDKKDYFFNKRVEEGMLLAYDDVVDQLMVLSENIDDEKIRQIATVSSNNNKEIGDLVYNAYKAVGKGGIINVEENHNSYKSTFVESKGYKLNKGWKNPFLINNKKTARFESEDAIVICYEGYLEGDKLIEDFINDNSHRPIVLFVERITEDTVINLTDFHNRGVLNICIVEAPQYDNKRKAILEDVALYTGGELFVKGSSEKVVAGEVDKVIVSESSCSFIQESLSEGVLERLSELKGQLEHVTDKEFIKDRIQKLEGVSATIYVGGTTESELKEKYDRVEDSVCSINSAQEEGWIAGGGSALAFISNEMNKDAKCEERQFGYEAFREALLEPLKTICRNSKRNPSKYLRKSKKIYGRGYNAYKDTESDLISDNIIDSTKSIRTALQNALSVTNLLLNTSVIITNNKSEF